MMLSDQISSNSILEPLFISFLHFVKSKYFYSRLFKEENEYIKHMVQASHYKDQVFLTHDHVESAELRTIFAYADMFVCPSKHDAMPLTPLEYVLANKGHGTIVLSNSLGAYRLLSTITAAFEADDPKALAAAIARSLGESAVKRRATMKLMKRVVLSSTIQKAIVRLKEDWQ